MPLVGLYLFEPIQSVEAVVAFVQGVYIVGVSTDEPFVEHLQGVANPCLVVVAVTMAVCVVMAKLCRIGLGIVGVVQPPVLAGLLTGIVGLEFYTEMVAPCKLMVMADAALKVQRSIAVQPFVQCAVDDGVAVGAVLAGAGSMAVAVADSEKTIDGRKLENEQNHT